MAKWLQLVAQLAPVVVAAAGLPVGIATAVTVGIQEAEAIKNASGSEKNVHVVNVVKAAAAGLNAVKPGTVDEATVSQAASSVVTTIVDVSKAIDAAHQPKPQA